MNAVTPSQNWGLEEIAAKLDCFDGVFGLQEGE